MNLVPVQSTVRSDSSAQYNWSSGGGRAGEWVAVSQKLTWPGLMLEWGRGIGGGDPRVW